MGSCELVDTENRGHVLAEIALFLVLLGPALGYAGFYASHVCVACLAVAIAVRVISGMDSNLGTKFVALVFLIVAYAAWQAVFRTQSRDGIAHVAILVASFGTMALGYYVTRNTLTAREMQKVFLLFCAMLIIVCVSEFILGLRLPVSRYSDFHFVKNGGEVDVAPYNVPTGFYGNQNNLALLVLVLLPVTEFVTRASLRRAVQVMLAGIIIATDSRIVIVSLILVVCVRVFLGLTGRMKIAAFAGACLAASLLMLHQPAPEVTCSDPSQSKFCNVVDRISRGAGIDDFLNQEDSLGVRFQLTEQALVLFALNPVLGIGPGTSSKKVSAHHFSSGDITNVHNPAVEVLAEYGIVGSLPWIVGWLLLLRSSASISQKRIRNSFVAVVLIIPVAVAAVSTLYFFTPFWGVVGMLAGLSRKIPIQS